jgi:hypothetical protein
MIAPSAIERGELRDLVWRRTLGVVASVAIYASLVCVFLAPSLRVLLMERSWWSPASLRRLHHRILRAGRHRLPNKHFLPPAWIEDLDE